MTALDDARALAKKDRDWYISERSTSDAMALSMRQEFDRTWGAVTAAFRPTVDALAAALAEVTVDPAACPYCEGTGWVFLDKSYDGYAAGRGGPKPVPYVEPDDTNGGYEPCVRCNSDEEVAFGSGDKVKPWPRWSADEAREIAEVVCKLIGLTIDA